MEKIEKDNPNRWFYAKIEGISEDSLKVFGYIGLQGKTELETGLPILVTFLTEEELQIAVDNIAGTDNYYQNQIEIDSSKFTGESGIYIRGLLVKEKEQLN